MTRADGGTVCPNAVCENRFERLEQRVDKKSDQLDMQQEKIVRLEAIALQVSVLSLICTDYLCDGLRHRRFLGNY